MLPGGSRIQAMPLRRFLAPGALLTDLHRLPEGGIPEGAAVLFETGMDGLYGSPAYYADHPVMDDALCEFLIRRRAALVGLDAPSPDRFPFPIHKKLLGAGIPILENLTGLKNLRGRAFTRIAVK